MNDDAPNIVLDYLRRIRVMQLDIEELKSLANIPATTSPTSG